MLDHTPEHNHRNTSPEYMSVLGLREFIKQMIHIDGDHSHSCVLLNLVSPVASTADELCSAPYPLNCNAQLLTVVEHSQVGLFQTDRYTARSEPGPYEQFKLRVPRLGGGVSLVPRQVWPTQNMLPALK